MLSNNCNISDSSTNMCNSSNDRQHHFSAANVLRHRTIINNPIKKLIISEPLQLNQPPIASSIIAKFSKSDSIQQPKICKNKLSKISRSNRGDTIKKRIVKSVVFNGTFPIDEPISSRFDEYDDGQDSQSNYSDWDGEDLIGGQSENEIPIKNDGFGGGISIDQLISNKNIKFNYEKMKNEYDRSFSAFDNLLDQRNRRRLLKNTFDIDEPIG